MTIKLSERVERIFNNRLRIGWHWHKIRTQPAMTKFVLNDPDIKAAMDSDADRLIAEMYSSARWVVSADATSLAYLRREMGEEEFEKFFAACALMASKKLK